MLKNHLEGKKVQNPRVWGWARAREPGVGKQRRLAEERVPGEGLGRCRGACPVPAGTGGEVLGVTPIARTCRTKAGKKAPGSVRGGTMSPGSGFSPLSSSSLFFWEKNRNRCGREFYF